MKPVLRPHRFPPLAQLHARREVEQSSPAQLQAALAEGFQEGLSKGYEEGYASGLQAGSEEAQTQGREQGLTLGRREMTERFEHLAAPVDALFSELKALQLELQAAARKEVVELVEKVARQVIRAELTLQPSQLLALVDETLASMPIARDGVEVFLNPEDLRRISELAPERAQAWSLLPDPKLESGECRLHAGGREADAGCRQRLAACMEQVKAQMIEQPHDEVPEQRA
ncbi:flagellar assembly protein FliH [Paucibacter sp. PLA-PC-4]|uniref:flagellar assembly protein FliH n=1 Tax=Paucibacter sp. PLA-PC-4 TaxID=2993655 RepID=UPI002248D835|nr:flagellar assembly protein FliH [Paucibacter sp. PLA-PC-4]MCX2861707.1 flagellar assembly protein FliH [Paucibacter sp. PLA-PC-4]